MSEKEGSGMGTAPRTYDSSSKYNDLLVPEDAYGARLQLCCCPEDDDGVPPPCMDKHCPFSHTNPCLNGSIAQKYIGRFGFSHFDKYRKLWLGFASWISILALAMTIYGCCSLSPNQSVVRRTYWAGTTGQNFSNDVPEFSMYVGLSTFILTNCSFIPGTELYPKRCHEHSIKYTSSECKLGPTGPACQACSDVAVAIWFGAVSNCVGLVLATNGAQIRMRRLADVPVQKLLGMVTDTIGFASLSWSLFQFRLKCFSGLLNALNNHEQSFRIWEGPGWICYVVCALSGLVRALVHFLTPCPEPALWETLRSRKREERTSAKQALATSSSSSSSRASLKLEENMSSIELGMKPQTSDTSPLASTVVVPTTSEE